MAKGNKSGRDGHQKKQRNIAPMMSHQREADAYRFEIKKYHLELDPKTGRPKR
jgi:hypothetical protein